VAAATSALQAEGLQVAGPYGPAGAHHRAVDRSGGRHNSVAPGTTVNIYTL
jgi:hypothetical protein